MRNNASMRRLLTPPLILIASLLMWLEETLWVGLKQATAWIALLPLMRRIEIALLQLPPYPMMAIFLLPMTLLFPLKILAVYWATRGHWLASLVLLVLAKILGTAVVARMYVVCQPKLNTIVWFRRVRDWLIGTRDHLYAAVRAMPLYQAARTQLAAIKRGAAQLLTDVKRVRGLGARWRAIRRWHRQKNKGVSSEES